MPIYESKGKLTGTIERENLEQAQAFLTEHDMTQFLDDSISKPIELVEWRLGFDGSSYSVRAITNRELTADELRVLAQWTSGQNSDGLGESFEQQEFAEVEHDDAEEDCGDCDGSGRLTYDDEGFELERDCDRCAGDGVLYYENHGMISFDWQTNDSSFTKIS